MLKSLLEELDEKCLRKEKWEKKMGQLLDRLITKTLK